MRRIITFEPEEIEPDKEAILKAVGIPDGAEISEKTDRLADEAINIFNDLSQPAGVIADLSVAHFEDVYGGEGLNADPSALTKIYPYADHLALFAISIGDRVCTEIKRLFDSDNFPLGTMLDIAASEATERAGIRAERNYLNMLINNQKTSPDHIALRYSPGYCGWHISGQKKLFDYLYPNEIGIYLNNSFLMQPIKSISGVILVGPTEIHEIEASYGFCEECRDKGCRERYRAIIHRG